MLKLKCKALDLDVHVCMFCVCQVSNYAGSGDLGVSWTGNCQEQNQVCSLQRFCFDMAAEGTYMTNINIFLVHVLYFLIKEYLFPFICLPVSRTVWAATVAQQWLQLWAQLQTTTRRHCPRCAMQTEQRTLSTTLSLMKTPMLASSGSSERK